MPDKLTRTKDMLKGKLTDYLESTTKGTYLQFFEGSPTYLTYYQLNSAESHQDGSLETVHSLVGCNTPNKYNRIYDLPVYGVDALDVQNDLNERGLQAIVNGEILILPDSIRPYPGDFFVFAYEGLESHLFRINDVQYDKLSPRKFFRCQYSLFQNNADNIFNNVVDNFEAQYTSEGGNGTSNAGSIEIVPQAEAASNKQAQTLVDNLIDKYVKLFYNEDTDTFICPSSGVASDNIAGSLNHIADSTFGDYYWSPYLQHFLHETKALSGYKNEILTEIYINDINEIDNAAVYSEEAYRNSIFRCVEIQNNEVNFDMNFLCVPEYDLKCTRNLPFFMSPLNFRLITPIVRFRGETVLTSYMNAYPLFFGSVSQLFKDVDHYHKVHIMDDVHIARIEPYIKAGDLIYECNRHELEPTKICIAIEKNDGTDTFLEIQDASIERLIKPSENIDIKGLELFNIIKSYLNDTFKLTEDVLKTLNELYYKPSVENYILIPMVLYILKQNIK